MNIYDHIIEPILFDKNKREVYESKLNKYQSEIDVLLVRVEEYKASREDLLIERDKDIMAKPLNGQYIRTFYGRKLGKITNRHNRIEKRIKEIRTERSNEQRRLYKKSNYTN